MSRRGNCHDNAVAESFFQLLKRERIKKKIYGMREEARSDIFDYIEMFYNSKRRHGSSDQMSPAEYESQYYHGLKMSRQRLKTILPLSTDFWKNKVECRHQRNTKNNAGLLQTCTDICLRGHRSVVL
ncbi:hypothetical protein GVv1_48090 (plasmid) [Enterobacter pseudoroggenkampii]